MSMSHVTILLSPIPTRRFTTAPTRRRATAVAGRRVSGEISNMLDISRQYPVARRRRSPGDQSPSCPLNRPYPLGDWHYNRRYNRPSSADCSADRLAGMALKVSCRMSLKPKMAHVALSYLGVYGHAFIYI